MLCVSIVICAAGVPIAHTMRTLSDTFLAEEVELDPETVDHVVRRSAAKTDDQAWELQEALHKLDATLPGYLELPCSIQLHVFHNRLS